MPRRTFSRGQGATRNNVRRGEAFIRQAGAAPVAVLTLRKSATCYGKEEGIMKGEIKGGQRPVGCRKDSHHWQK